MTTQEITDVLVTLGGNEWEGRMGKRIYLWGARSKLVDSTTRAWWGKGATEKAKECYYDVDAAEVIGSGNASLDIRNAVNKMIEG